MKISARGALGTALLCLSCLAAPPGGRADDYTVAEGDLLQVTVFEHPDLVTTARIDREGQIRFPLLGQVPVGGLTASGIADLLTEKLANGYLVAPQVAVSIQEYRARKASIMGKVNRPGVYEFRGQTTFLELLSRAGGLSPEAGGRAVVTRRVPGGAGATVQVDLRALLVSGDARADVEIRDGDSVYVEEAGTFFLAGEVRRPGEYRHEEGMTLIRAITLAGGFTERAATDSVRLIREEGGQGQVLEFGAGTASLEEPVRRGDIVIVNVARAEVCYVTGEVKSAGAYHCGRDTTVIKAVTLAGGFTDAAARSKVRIIRKAGGREQVLDKVGLDELVQPDDVIIVPKSFF